LSAAELHEQNRNEPGGPMGEKVEDATESVARTLSQARQAYGQDLRSVAEALRIRYVYLDAIESGRFQDLPGPAYAIGFVRTYSEFLGLDSNEIVTRFKKEVDGLDGQTQLHFLAPAPESRIPGAAVLLICGLIAVLAYGGWYYLSHRGTDVAGLIPNVPERMQSLIGSGGATDETAEETPAVSAEPEQTAATDGESSVPATPAEFTESTSAEQADAQAAPETIPPAEVEEEPAAAAVSVEPQAESTPVEAIADEAPEATGTAEAVGDPADEAVVQATPSEPANPAVTVASSVSDDAAQAPTAADEADAGEADREEASQPKVVEAAPAGETQREAEAAQDSESAESNAEIADAFNSGAQSEADAVSPNETEALPGSGAAQTAPVDAGETPRADPLQSAEATSPNATRFPQVIDSSPSIPVAPELPEDAGFFSEHEPIVYGEDNGDFRVRLVAAQDCWVQVRDDEGKLLLTRVLRAGDSYQVPNKKGLTLLTGNAGGLYIELDGTRLPVLGPVGVVRRDVSLDPERLLGGGTASLQ